MKKTTTGIILSAIATLHLQAVDVPNISDALKEVTPPKIKKKKRYFLSFNKRVKSIKKVLKMVKRYLSKVFQ